MKELTVAQLEAVEADARKSSAQQFDDFMKSETFRALPHPQQQQIRKDGARNFVNQEILKLLHKYGGITGGMAGSAGYSMLVEIYQYAQSMPIYNAAAHEVLDDPEYSLADKDRVHQIAYRVPYMNNEADYARLEQFKKEVNAERPGLKAFFSAAGQTAFTLTSISLIVVAAALVITGLPVAVPALVSGTEMLLSSSVAITASLIAGIATLNGISNAENARSGVKGEATRRFNEYRKSTGYIESITGVDLLDENIIDNVHDIVTQALKEDRVIPKGLVPAGA